MNQVAPEPSGPQWWVVRHGRRHGPLSWEHLKSLCHTGRIARGDAICRTGEPPTPVEQFADELFPPQTAAAVDVAAPPIAREAPPPPPPSRRRRGARTWTTGFDRQALGKQLRSSSSLARLFITRILQSDFGLIQPTPDEKLRLMHSAVPLTAELAQAYAAWRRSMLSVACVLLSVNAVLGIGNLTTTLDGRFSAWNFIVIGSVSLSLFSVQVIGACLTGWAAWRWDDIRLSRRLARASWAVVFLLPILILAIPISKLVSLGGGWVAQGIVVKLVAERAIVLIPRVLGLFPGIIRACLTLKTLVPESAAPGYTAIIVAPAYALFFFVSVALAVQLTLSPALILGLLLLGIAPLVYVLRARDLMRSHGELEGRQLVARLRRHAGTCTGVGLLCILVQLLRWIDLGDISWRMLISSVAGLIGSLLLFTVAGCDLILALLRQNFETSRSFEGSEQQRQLEEKFIALTRVGLTDLEAGEADLVRRVRETVEQASRRGRQP